MEDFIEYAGGETESMEPLIVFVGVVRLDNTPVAVEDTTAREATTKGVTTKQDTTKGGTAGGIEENVAGVDGEVVGGSCPVDHPLKTALPETVSSCSLVSGKDGVCASDAALQVMERLVPNSGARTREELVAAVKKALDVDDERAVIESKEFARVAPRGLVQQELVNYKVEGPTDVSLLSNFNIDKTLQQWTAKYPDFYPYNFNMRDYEKRGDSLATVDVGELYTRGFRVAGCVINSDYYSGRGKHWMALVVDMRKPPFTVEFFNSSGNAALPEFVAWQVKARSQLLRHCPDTQVIRVTERCHQKSRTECGVYSLYYIYARLIGIPYTEFAMNDVSDLAMFEFREHLFTDKRRAPVRNWDYDEFKSGVEIKWETGVVPP